MSISDTFYIALCMTVLMLGIFYWFWTQNQYLQRKMNLLENIVYEMKTSLNNGGPGLGNNIGAIPAAPMDSEESYPKLAPMPIDSEGLQDITDVEADAIETDELHAELHGMVNEHSNDVVLGNDKSEIAPENYVSDELQPGGVGSGIQAQDEPDAKSKGSVLDGMTTKELRRLAEQKGITVHANMRKSQLIEAIRGNSTTQFDVKEGTTLDFAN